MGNSILNMGKDYNSYISKKNKNGKQVYEKVLNISNLQRTQIKTTMIVQISLG